MGGLAAHYVAHLPSAGPAASPDDPDLEQALAALLREARQRYPEVDVTDEVYVTYLASKREDHETSDRFLDTVCGPDLYLALACKQGDDAATRILRQRVLQEIAPALRRFNPSEFFVDEVQQVVSELLLLGTLSGTPKIGQYSGRGSLRAWIRVIAMREAQRIASRYSRERPLDEGVLLRAVISDEDPELAFVKAEYRAVFKQHLHQALRALSVWDRRLLQQHLVKGLGIDQLATKHGVHRATAARWLAKLRDALLRETRRSMQASLQIDATDFDSVMRLIASNIQASFGRVLDEKP